jgi:hypothetical protein
LWNLSSCRALYNCKFLVNVNGHSAEPPRQFIPGPSFPHDSFYCKKQMETQKLSLFLLPGTTTALAMPPPLPLMNFNSPSLHVPFRSGLDSIHMANFLTTVCRDCTHQATQTRVHCLPSELDHAGSTVGGFILFSHIFIVLDEP